MSCNRRHWLVGLTVLDCVRLVKTLHFCSSTEKDALSVLKEHIVNNTKYVSCASALIASVQSSPMIHDNESHQKISHFTLC